MNKLLLMLAIGSALACAGCNKGLTEDRGATAATEAPAEMKDVLAEVQATNSVVVTVPAQAPAAGNTAAPQPRFPALLSSERTLMESDSLSAAKVTQIIKTDKFDKFVDRLKSDAAADPLAQDLTLAERKRWEGKLGDKASLGEFACGLSVCAGTIGLGGNTAFYDGIVDDFLQNGPQGGSLLDYRVDLGNGSYEQRFVMSLDPTVRGVTFNGQAPGAK
ncbi:hypothetical protein GCM10027431_15230 [Lysobacter rhizosphaerae]